MVQPTLALVLVLDGVFGGWTMAAEGPRFRIVVEELQLWRRREFWCGSSTVCLVVEFTTRVVLFERCSLGEVFSANRPGDSDLSRVQLTHNTGRTMRSPLTADGRGRVRCRTARLSSL